MAHFHINQAEAGMSIYRQFEGVNGVKYKRSEGTYLRGSRGRLTKAKITLLGSVYSKKLV